VDYFSFEDVMKELELGEEELKRMVSEGELRAFRDENKMKFKKEDVESLKKGRITEPTIILPSTPTLETTDETVLDLDIGQETAALSDTSIPKVEMGAGKSPGSTDEDLLIQTEEVGTEGEETFIEEESDTGLFTEPLKLADETEQTVEAEAVTEDVAPAAKRRTSARTRAGRRVSAQIPVAVEEEIERKKAHWIWTLLIFIAFIASAYGGLFFYDTMRMETGRADQPSNMTAGLAQWTLEQFWRDPNWTKFHTREYPAGKAPPFQDADPRIKHQPYEKPTFKDKPMPVEAAAPQ
jgi:hypothetical protein